MRDLFALLALGCLTLVALGQTPASPQPTVRYHFGDNSQWANPASDDSSWAVAQNGLVPSRSRDTDRFLWVRLRVPVPENLNGPLALHLDNLGVQPMTWQVFRQRPTHRRPGSFPAPCRSRRSSRFSGDGSALFARPAGLRGADRAARVACPRLLGIGRQPSNRRHRPSPCAEPQGPCRRDFLQSPAFQHLCQIVVVAGIAAFDCILFPVCIREIFRPGGNRAIAAAQSLMEVIILLGVLGYSVHLTRGPFPLDLFQLTLTLLDLAIAAMLFRRAWKAWKESNSLRAEFQAAREVQQQLVTAPPSIPGFRIEAEYRPAAQMGGDFYRVVPGEDGDVLVVVGDVSGKGLRAAMTVSAIVGSLRMLPARTPAEILGELNRSLAGRLRRRDRRPSGALSKRRGSSVIPQPASRHHRRCRVHRNHPSGFPRRHLHLFLRRSGRSAIAHRRALRL